MKTVIKVGTVAWPFYKARLSAELEVAYEPNKDGKMVFSVCGKVYTPGKQSYVMSGQCLDDMKPLIQPQYQGIFDEVYDLWKKYHLNDMHAECKHQAALGWREMAQEKVQIRHFKLTKETCRQRSELKARFMKELQAGKTVTATPEEQLLLALEYEASTEDAELAPRIAGFYEFVKEETQTRGWLRAEEDPSGLLGKPYPSGLLCKPCPVCGYKYGSSWNYFRIPKKDEQRIWKLLGVDSKLCA